MDSECITYGIVSQGENAEIWKNIHGSLKIGLSQTINLDGSKKFHR